MNLLQQLEIVEACQAWAGIETIEDPKLRSRIVRMVVRCVMQLERADIQDAKMKQEVKDALVKFQLEVLEIQADFLLSKHNLWTLKS